MYGMYIKDYGQGPLTALKLGQKWTESSLAHLTRQWCSACGSVADLVPGSAVKSSEDFLALRTSCAACCLGHCSASRGEGPECFWLNW